MLLACSYCCPINYFVKFSPWVKCTTFINPNYPNIVENNIFVFIQYLFIYNTSIKRLTE